MNEIYLDGLSASKTLDNPKLNGKTGSKKKPVSNGFLVTGEELLNKKQDKLKYLVEGLLPETGVVALVGSSDTGKSSFLRQLAMSIVYKDADFLGFQIQAKHNSVIYVSTEDDGNAMAYLLNKQKVKEKEAKELKRLLFVFDTEDLLKKLDKALQDHKVDCVIIDTFTDIYSGDLVAANKVRSYINDFVNLSKKHNCLLVFLHHTGKRTEAFPPSKDNILGSQGFEAKMRLVIEIRRDFTDYQIRHLCIVKGNYVRDKDKSESYVLKFDDEMRYSNTGKRTAFESLVKPEPKKTANKNGKAMAMELKKVGCSISEIAVKLSESGHKYSRSTIGNWVKDAQSKVPEERLDEDETEGDG